MYYVVMYCCGTVLGIVSLATHRADSSASAAADSSASAAVDSSA